MDRIFIERATSTTPSFPSLISSTIHQNTCFTFQLSTNYTQVASNIQHSHFINPNPISYHFPLSAPKTLPSITKAMASLSATSLTFQPSLNFSTAISQVPKLQFLTTANNKTYNIIFLSHSFQLTSFIFHSIILV